MEVQIGRGWKVHLQQEFGRPCFAKLTELMHAEYSQFVCYPPGKPIFNASNLCPFDQMKVVIIGQDPYHEQDRAHGLSFSTNDGVPFPLSLQSIFKEVQVDIGMPIPTIGNLTRQAEQGVVLLNTTLIVRARAAGSHRRRGWETFTDTIIKLLSNHKEHSAFLLWGDYARSKSYLISKRKHCVLESIRPLPLSANRGSRSGNHHFSRCNKYLVQQNIEPVKW